MRIEGVSPSGSSSESAPTVRDGLLVLKDKLADGLEGTGFEIDDMEEFAEAVRELSDHGLEDMDAFEKAFVFAINAHTFDAERLAEKLPDEIREFNEENDIDDVKLVRALDIMVSVLRTELSGSAYDAEGNPTEEWDEARLLGLIGSIFGEGVEAEA